MPTQVIVYVLTALAAVAIVLTRLRLSGSAAGRVDVGSRLLAVHTVAGGLALAGWLVYLVAAGPLGEGAAGLVGIASLACWWVVAGAGLLILGRWLPSRGRHAADATSDTWSEGPGLSVLAHVGMLVGVIVFTWAYLVAAV